MSTPLAIDASTESISTGATANPAPHVDGSEAQTPQPARESQTLAVSSLVLGLVSLLFSYTFLVPIAGIVIGAMALKREPASRTMSIWGIVLSSVMLFGTLAAIVFSIALLVPFGLAAAVI